MMKFLLIAIPLLAAAGCSSIFCEQGSGKRATQDRTVPAFTGINLEGSAEVTVTKGATQKVTIEIDDNLLDNVTTEVKGNSLVISSKKGYSTRIGLHVTIVSSSINEVAIAGSGTIHVDGVTGPSFDASISGSGEIIAKGTVDALKVGIAGSGTADLSKLAAETADASISGSGSLTVNAKDTLNAQVSGSGAVHYVGKPKKVNPSVTGSGSVEAAS